MAVLKDLPGAMKEAKERMTSQDFMRAVSLLSQNKDQVREKIQGITVAEIRGVIGKLKSAQPLSNEDIQCMKLWIVGDAQGYVKMENNFNDWLSEFERLTAVLSEYGDKELSEDDLSKLHGVLEDALRVGADIGNFLEKKERMKNFDTAVQDTANLDRDILVRILEQKIESASY